MVELDLTEKSEPPKWRVVLTDTESASGVAPLCDKPEEHRKEDEGAFYLDKYAPDDIGSVDNDRTYDCCPMPVLQVWQERDAVELRDWLNSRYVEYDT